MASDALPIVVVYALPNRQDIVRLTVPPATTVAAAVELSGLLNRHPQLRAEELNCAIYSRIVPLTQTVSAGDRIEILRPLLIDPAGTEAEPMDLEVTS